MGRCTSACGTIRARQDGSLALRQTWAAIGIGEQAGTIDSPIKIPDDVATSGMEYEYGKYYMESGTTYLMDRQGMSIGDAVILYFPPSALEGQYFEVVQEG